ncbi:MAG: DUF3793 family protein, partial [Clostridium sp.]
TRTKGKEAMSTEILEIVQQMDLHNAETQLALQCAPLIAGVKISNLLVVSTGMEDAVKQCLRKSGISFLLLLRTREKARYLLFRKKPLEAYLMRKEIRELLQESGYQDFTLGNISTFQKRYQGYMCGEPGFPQEMECYWLSRRCKRVYGTEWTECTHRVNESVCARLEKKRLSHAMIWKRDHHPASNGGKGISLVFIHSMPQKAAV